MGLFGTTIHNHIPKPEPPQSPRLLSAYDAMSFMRQFEEEARNKVLAIYRPEGNQIHCTVTAEQGDFEILARVKFYINSHEYDVPLRFRDIDLQAAGGELVERVREIIAQAITGHVIEDVLRTLVPIYSNLPARNTGYTPGDR